MTLQKSLISVLFAAALASTVGCDRTGPEQPVVVSAHKSAVPASSIYALAVSNPARSEKDRQRDPLRKPAEVLQFFGIEPGAKVLDLFSGGGYYTELLSYAVGDTGRVVAHTNTAYANFVGDEAISRYAEGRLPNVEILHAENNELVLPKSTFDFVTLILTYHDIYYIAPDDGWPKIDGPALLAELYESMKPGAVLGVVDHVAERGAPRETGNTLHRIDPELARLEIEKAGFIFEEASDLLHNPDDDHTLNMADPAIRGRTDRFVVRFRKPG